MTAEEREHSKLLVYQMLPSRYGMNPDDLRKADAIEIVDRAGRQARRRRHAARAEDLPARRQDAHAAGRHRPALGLPASRLDRPRRPARSRSASCARSPTGRSRSTSRSARARPYYDTALAVKAGADVVVLDGMQGGTAATQEVFIEHVGIPILAAIRPAVQALQELGMHRKVQLIVSGGIRNGADVAKALALGADAVSIGTAALIALGDNDPRYEDEYRALGTHGRLL